MNLNPLILSGKLALVTTFILLVTVSPIAYFLTHYRFKGKSFLEAFLPQTFRS